MIPLVVVVCEHGVSPALKDPEVSHPKLHLRVVTVIPQIVVTHFSLLPRSSLFLLRTAQSLL